MLWPCADLCLSFSVPTGLSALGVELRACWPTKRGCLENQLEDAECSSVILHTSSHTSFVCVPPPQAESIKDAVSRTAEQAGLSVQVRHGLPVTAGDAGAAAPLC